MPLRLRVTSDSKALPRDQRVREFPAVGGTIGRGPDNDWVLPDDSRYVSSRHAVIDFQGGAYYLVDTSRNGRGPWTPTRNRARLFSGTGSLLGVARLSV